MITSLGVSSSVLFGSQAEGVKQQQKEIKQERKTQEKEETFKEIVKMGKKEQTDNRSTQESADMVKTYLLSGPNILTLQEPRKC